MGTNKAAKRLRTAGALAAIPLAMAVVGAPLASSFGVINHGQAGGTAGMLRYGYILPVSGPVPGWDSTFGTYLVPADGSYGVCLDAGRYDQTTSAPVTYQQSWEVNYALFKYLNTTDDHVAAALDFYVGFGAGVGLGVNGEQATMQRAWDYIQGNASLAGPFNAALDMIKADVIAHAGPYVAARPTLGQTYDQYGTVNGGSVGNIGIQSINGNWMGGAEVIVTLEGPAVFTDTGTATKTIAISADGPVGGLGWVPTGLGQVKVSFATVGTPFPGDQYTMFPAPTADHQRLATYGNLTGAHATDPVVIDVTPPAPLVPTVTTTTSSAVAVAGDTLTDTIATTGGFPGRAFTGSSTLYGPYDTMPSGSPDPAKAVGTATFSGTWDASGAATVTSTGIKVPSVGYYTWVETLYATQGASTEEPTTDAVTGPFGVVSETSLVPPAPKVATQVSDQKVNVGTRITDSVTVSGLVATAPDGSSIDYTMSIDLRGPLAPVDNSCAGLDWSTAAKIAVPSVKVTGNGTKTVGDHTVTEPGCYSYGETLVGTWGGKTVTTSTHEVGKTEQTSIATAPTVSTKVSDQAAINGQTITDTAIVGGIVDAPNSEAPDWSLVPTLVKAPAIKTTDGIFTCTGVDYSAAEKVSINDAPVKITADGTFGGIGSVVVSATDEQPTCYSYGETLIGTTVDGITVKVDHEPGHVTQTSLVTRPNMVTTVSNLTPNLGGKVVDSIVVTGTQGKEAVITAELWGAMDPIKADDGALSCSSDAKVWYDAKDAGTIEVLHSEEIAVAGDGTYDTAEVILDESKCYTWVEKMVFPDVPGTPGNPDQPTDSTEPGEVPETPLVKTPTMVTQTSRQNATVGATLTDTIVVEGLDMPGTIDVALYGPMNPANGTCSNNHDEWAAGIASGEIKMVGSSKLTIDKAGSFTTEGVQVNQTGCYTWYEKMTTGNADKPTIVETKYGEVSETTLVTETQSIVTEGMDISTGFGSGETNPATGAAVAGALLALVGAGLAGRRAMKSEKVA